MNTLNYIIGYILWLIVHIIFVGVIFSTALLIFGDGAEKFLYYLFIPYFLFFIRGQGLLIKDKEQEAFNSSTQISFTEKQNKEDPSMALKYLSGNITIGIIVIVFYGLFGVKFLVSII